MKSCALAVVTMLALYLGGCRENTFSVQSLPQVSDSTQNIGDTVYVEQYPVWTGFSHPQGVIVGNEPLIYVADTDNDRLVMLDLSGRVISYSKKMTRPVALTQDKRLQLLVCAQFDTTLPGRTSPTTFGALYRLDLVAANHNLGSITPTRVYFDPGDSLRRFTGVAAMYNNQYYLARVGPNNAVTSPDRDNAILQFSENDQLLSPVTATFSPNGTGLLSISTISAVAAIPTSRVLDFIFCQTGTTELYKVQWIQYVIEGQNANYLSKFYPSVDGNIDLLKINHFIYPAGLTVDPAGNLYVVDAVKDSLYRFSTRGIERYSFGGFGSGDRQFNEPYSVAFFDKTVYVADRGNNRIVRFKLSSDID